jgi:SAM-dependent methyltransferase
MTMPDACDLESRATHIETEQIAHQCPLCLNLAAAVGQATYYDANERYATPVFYCKRCNLYGRIVTAAQIRSHIPATSYVQPQSESKWLRSRAGFFEYILKVVDQYLAKSDRQRSLVDFGSAYGHLIDIAIRQGFKSTGVEASRELVEITRARGLNVVESVDDLPHDIDVFTIIDSLYLIQDPIALMSKIRTRLSDGGIAVIRITNRNWIAGIRRLGSGNPDLSVLGDTIYSYSLRSLRELLKQAGMKVVRVIPDGGAGKKTVWQKAWGYKMLSLISNLSCHTLLLSPGLIVVATSNEIRPSVQAK